MKKEAHRFDWVASAGARQRLEHLGGSGRFSQAFEPTRQLVT
jgi:hypothetical protein